MSDSHIEITTKKDLKEYVQKNPVVIVKFKAEWCGPCKKINPLVNRLMKQYDKMKYVVVDVDNGGGIASQLRIRSIPTLASYLDGDIHGIISTSDTDEIQTFFKETNTHVK
jgi:thioredoxin 1